MSSKSTTPKAPKLSICQIHGTRHALSSGLCADPDCVGRIITTHAKANRTIKRNWHKILKAGLARDFEVWVIEELLREQQKYGKPPTLNIVWLSLRVRHFLWHQAGKYDLPTWKIPATAKKELQKATIYYEDLRSRYDERGDGHIFDAMINNNIEFSGMYNNTTTPEEDVEYNELKTFIIVNFGEPWALYAEGQINITDCSKLTGLKIAEIRQAWEHIRKRIKTEYFGAWKQDLLRIEEMRKQKPKNTL
jgi:hypothetical protein